MMPAPPDTLQLPEWRRLQDIENTKKYKGRQQGFPMQRNAGEGQDLPCDFVNHDAGRILNPQFTGNISSGANAHDQHNGGDYECRRDVPNRREQPWLPPPIG